MLINLGRQEMESGNQDRAREEKKMQIKKGNPKPKLILGMMTLVWAVLVVADYFSHRSMHDIEPLPWYVVLLSVASVVWAALTVCAYIKLLGLRGLDRLVPIAAALIAPQNMLLLGIYWYPGNGSEWISTVYWLVFLAAIAIAAVYFISFLKWRRRWKAMLICLLLDGFVFLLSFDTV